LRYVNKIDGAENGKRVPVIMAQEGRKDVEAIISEAPIDIQVMVINHDPPLVVSQGKSIAEDAFAQNVSLKIKNAYAEPADVKWNLTFLSHYKNEASAVARLLKMLLNNRCKRRKEEKPELLENARIFLDSDNLTNLKLLRRDVKRTKVMIIVLTKIYFTRPWCLVELHTALEAGVPLIPVKVADGGYDFEEQKKFLETLTPETLNAVTKNGAEVLEHLGIDVTELGKRLAKVIPNLAAVEIDTKWSEGILRAQANEILDQILQICSTHSAV
jgi:hypothetical protein